MRIGTAYHDPVVVRPAFSLRTLVNQAIETTGLDDPGDLAAFVLDRVGDQDLRAALAETLRDYVRHALSYQRLAPVEQDTSEVEEPDDSEDRAGDKPVFRSRKIESRQRWARELHLHKVHAAADTWVALGRCTAAHLTFAAEERRDRAARSNAWAAWYEMIAQKVAEHQVERVEELPRSVISQIFGVKP